MEFSREAYWSGLPFPSPGDFPDPGIEPGSPSLQADALPPELLGNPKTSPGWTYFRHTVHKIPSHYPKYSNQIRFSTSTLVQLHFLNSEPYIKPCEIFLDPGRWLSGKESACQRRRCRRPGFDPWIEKIPWRRKWQPILVFLPLESHG